MFIMFEGGPTYCACLGRRWEGDSAFIEIYLFVQVYAVNQHYLEKFYVYFFTFYHESNVNLCVLFRETLDSIAF